jgi:hypothetical protein
MNQALYAHMNNKRKKKKGLSTVERAHMVFLHLLMAMCTIDTFFFFLRQGLTNLLWSSDWPEFSDPTISASLVLGL